MVCSSKLDSCITLLQESCFKLHATRKIIPPGREFKLSRDMLGVLLRAVTTYAYICIPTSFQLVRQQKLTHARGNKKQARSCTTVRNMYVHSKLKTNCWPPLRSHYPCQSKRKMSQFLLFWLHTGIFTTPKNLIFGSISGLSPDFFFFPTAPLVQVKK